MTNGSGISGRSGVVAAALALTVSMGPALADTNQPDFAELAQEASAESEALRPQQEVVAEQTKRAKARLVAEASYNESYYQHQAWVLKYTRWVYYWHFLSTVIVFFLVAGIVIFGLRLSYLQFKKDFLSRAQKLLHAQPAAASGTSGVPAPEPTGQGQPSVHSLKLGLQGIEISSSVIGLLILGLSLGFFYLYLDQVYPIKPEGATQQQSNAGASSSSRAQGSE